MRTTTIVIGLVFGVILGGVLLAPLFVALPARYVDNWYYVSPEWALAGLAAGLLVTALAGFVVGMADDEAAIRNGTLAGLLACLYSGGLIVLPAALIEATGDLLAMAAYDTLTAKRLTEATVSAAIGAAWTPAATGLAMGVGGAALGAMGGVLYDLWRGTTAGRSARLVHRSLVPMVGLSAVALAMGLSSLWSAHLDLTVLPKLGYTPGFQDRSLLTLPLITAGVAACWFLAWGVRDVVITWRDDRRFGALVWLTTLLGLLSLGPVLVGVFHGAAWLTPAPWLVVVGSGIVFFVALIGAIRSDLVREPRPRSFGEAFAEVLFAAILVVMLPWFVSGSSITGSLLVVFPYARALVSGAGVVDSPPGEAVNAVFGWHLLLLLPLTTSAILLFIMGATPFWLFRRALRG